MSANRFLPGVKDVLYQAQRRCPKVNALGRGLLLELSNNKNNSSNGREVTVQEHTKA